MNIQAEEVSTEVPEDTGTLVMLDLSEHCMLFGGFPEYKDCDQLQEGILTDDVTDPVAADNAGAADYERGETTYEDAYALISDSIDAQNESIDVTDYHLTQDEATDVVTDVLNDNSMYFYVEGVSAYVTEDGNVDSIEMLYAAHSTEERQEYLDNIYEIISQINPDWNDLQKYLFLHDYLCEHCEYSGDDTSTLNSAYSTIVQHAAKCSGYSRAFDDLCYYAGVEAHYVVSRELDHAWNLVKLNDSYYL